MYGKNCAVLLAFTLFCGVNSWKRRSEQQCIDYYKTGENFDLGQLNGNMNAVYFWPPNQRQRDTCEGTGFRILSSAEVDTLSSECSALRLPSNADVVKVSYRNGAGKFVDLYYYGSGEEKSMYRSCDRPVSRYLFIKVNADHVLGINCSAGGRGVLLSRLQPRRDQVQAVVNGIEIMSGRDGSPDCPIN